MFAARTCLTSLAFILFISFRTSYLFTKLPRWPFLHKMATFDRRESGSTSNWNAEAGVWLNEMAPNSQVLQLPKPLYIFGYGSLLWRPGKYLDQLSQYHAKCLGWTRRFAQKSCDHRGTSEFPGLVLTLIESEYLRARGMCYQTELTVTLSTSTNSQEMDEHCTGAVFYIPGELVVDVINELDFREKGGYRKQLIKVQLMEATEFHNAGDIADALVYVGAVDNPNFYLPLAHKDVLVHHKGSQIKYFMSRTSDVITTAIGPSGSNVDYLLNLVSYLNDMKFQDDHLNQLADIVRHRLGPWRSNWTTATTPPTAPGEPLMQSYIRLLQSTVGWGSNEFGQISLYRQSSDADIILFPQPIHSLNYRYATDRKETSLKRISQENPHLWAISGGRISGVLSKDGLLVLWGSLAKETAGSLSSYEADASPAGTAHSTDSPVIAIANVRGAAAGHDHLLLLMQSGFVLSIGDDTYKQSSAGAIDDDWLVHLKPAKLDATLAVNKVGNLDLSNGLNVPVYECRATSVEVDSMPSIVMLAAGLRHSAGITAQGGLLTWGCNRYRQCSADTLSTWMPPDGAKVIDIACGARHTVAIDDQGRMWITGNSKYIAETRFGPSDLDAPWKMKRIENVEAGIRWQRVSSGWSHIVARGVRPDGSLVCVGIGRRDMGQFPAISDNKCGDLSSLEMPHHDCSSTGMSHLAALPDNCPIREVWAGSEFTLACDSNHRLWSCGWNEHGNLGLGHRLNSLTWSRVCDDQGRHLAINHVWEGALACGGSHVLCTELDGDLL